MSKHEDPVEPNLRAKTCDLRTHNYAEFVHSFLLSTTSIFSLDLLVSCQLKILLKILVSCHVPTTDAQCSVPEVCCGMPS